MRSPKSRASVARLELEETNAAFASVRAKAIAELTATAPDNLPRLQVLVCRIQALDAVKAELTDVVNAGLIEDAIDARNDS